MRNSWKANWKRALSLALSFVMVFSTLDIVPGSRALASELEETDVSAQNEEAAEPSVSDSELTEEEPEETEQSEAEEEPTAAPTPEATPVPEATVAPEVAPDDAPEAGETAEPTQSPETTEVPAATPEATQTPAPTEVPSPLALTLTSDVRSGFVDGEAIGVTLRMEGGVPEYAVTYRVYLDGTQVEEGQMQSTAESESGFSFVARAFGVHTIEASVLDAAGQTEVAFVAVPVAEHDTDSLEQQRQKAERVKLTGNWRKDMLAVAASQLGYRESERDFIIREDGAVRGYTVYGDWYGLPYEEWDAMFVSFCASLAGIPMSGFPQESSSRQMLDETAARGAYHARGGEYEPQAGDLVFYCADEEDASVYVAVVERATANEIHTIEGGRGRAVARKSYDRGDCRIMGYASVRAMMIAAGALEDAVQEAQELIDALPGVEELSAMDIDAQRAAYEQTQAAYDAYMALTEAQRAQIEGAEIFETLFAFFNGQIMLLATYSGGDGTAEHPYVIATPQDMWTLAANSADWDKHFVLTASVDLGCTAENQWLPIGIEGQPFKGVFDGGENTISGLYIETTNHYQGLFGYVTNGNVRNLHVVGSVTAGGYVGGIVGELFPSDSDDSGIEGCSFEGNVNGGNGGNSGTNMFAGGVVGHNHSGRVIGCSNSGTVNCSTQHAGGIAGGNEGSGATVEDCKNTANVNMSSGNTSSAGGIVGLNNGGAKVISCHNEGDVDGAVSMGEIGGIVGQNKASVTNCDNEGAVKGGSYVGGVAGRNSSGTITGSYNIAEVSGASYIGGVAGVNEPSSKITECYSTGTISGTGSYIGGVAGQNASTVTNCYNGGSVSGATVGGVVGQNFSGTSKSTKTGKIENCYNSGTVTGSNAGSLVSENGNKYGTGKLTNCYYLSGTASDGIAGSDKVDGAEEKDTATFNSGEIAWRLYHGNGGAVWGQRIIGDSKNPYPVLNPPKVLKVTFQTETNKSYQINYTNSGGDVPLPKDDLATDENHVFYEWHVGKVDGEKFEGRVTGNDDVIIVATQRERFGGEDEQTTVVRGVYGETIEKNLDSFVGYASGMTSTANKFTYTITDWDGLDNAVMNGNVLTVAPGADVNEAGYVLKITAHERDPQVSLLSIGSVGVSDVSLSVRVIIEKATPKLEVTASAIDFGQTLGESILSGTASHPTTGADVEGAFAWDTPEKIPGVVEAASVGYLVRFTPRDAKNYNPATVTVKPTVKKVRPAFTEPEANNGTYTGEAQKLVTEGTTSEGTMEYLLDGEEGDYSSTVPSKANAGDYKVWYKVLGDENHTDTDPQFVTVRISPCELTVPEQRFTYNGSKSLTLTRDGVHEETVTVTLTASSKDAGSYAFGDGSEGTYAATIESPNEKNYAVAENSGKLIIEKRSVNLSWSKDLVFTYHSGERHTVTATVDNVAEGDSPSLFELEYEHNQETDVGEYTAKVTGLGDKAKNYTLEGAQNTSKTWHILKEQKTIEMEQVGTITYGDRLTLKADIHPDSSGMGDTDTVAFYADGVLLDIDPVIDTNAAILTIENATSALGFSVGTCAISVKYSGNSNEEGAESDAVTLTVECKPIEAQIAQSDISKVYDGDANAAGLSLAFKAGDIEAGDEDGVTATAKSFTYNSKNVKEAHTVTANGIELSGEKSGNYTVNKTAETKGSITPKTVALEWRGVTGLRYTGNRVNVTATARELVSGEACGVTVEGGREKHANTDENPIYTARTTELDNPNYALPDDGTTEQTYVILPAQLIVPEQTKPYSGKNVFSAEMDGVTPTDGETEKVALTLTADRPDVGKYAFAAEGAEGYAYTASTADTNYEIVNGAALTIEKAVPDVTWPAFTGNVFVNDEPLTKAYFTDGSATGVDGGDLPGTFALSGKLSWDKSGDYAVTFTFTPEDSVNYVEVSNGHVAVRVNKRRVASVAAQTAITDKPYGTEQDGLGLPTAVTITTEDGKTFYNVPVTWTGYDPTLLTEQNLVGGLDLSDIEDEVENPSDVKAAIKVRLRTLTPGSFEYKDKTAVYSGDPIRHEIEGDIEGVKGVRYEYAGADGAFYGPTGDAPTEAGVYTVTANFEMEDGYEPIGAKKVNLTIEKADPDVITAPRANNRVYDGVARELVTGGSVAGGSLLYSMDKDGVYTAAVPMFANAKTYTVWYRVEGDANHNNTDPQSVTVTISPATVDVIPGHITYNGGAVFQLALDGVRLSEDACESVTATLIAYSKDAGEYAYAEKAASGAYTLALSSANYAVGETAALTIDPLPAVLSWSEKLTFTYTGETYTVRATVGNAIGEDAFALAYTGETGRDEGEYTAVVTSLGNANYTLDGAANVSQTWYITRESETVTLTADERVTYGDELTLSVTVTPRISAIRLMSAAQDEVEFYANGVLLSSVPVTYEDDGRDSGTATFKVKATSANHFFASSQNAVYAVYGGNRNVEEGESACVTVTVEPKRVDARITGIADKTYDGSETATGLALELDGVEDCDRGHVTATAVSYAYDDASAGEGKTVTAQSVALEGEQRGNYVIANESITTTGTIARKTVRLVWSGYTDLVYTGKAVNVTATAAELVPEDVCDVEVAGGDGIDAGTYIATATGLTNPNYILPDIGWQQDYTIAKADPAVTAPTALDSVYDGMAHRLLEEGGVDGGEMLYSMEEGGEFSADIPERISAGTYTVWYRVKGDDNHNDAGPWAVTSVIVPARIDIETETVVYNGESAFPITVDGVNGERVTVTLIASAKDAGAYDYAEEAANGKYTVSFSSANYAVGTAARLTIAPLPAVLSWSDPLSFTYTGKAFAVSASVSNRIGDDAFELSYRGNSATNVGDYKAEVISLGNANYTLDGAVNATQAWVILKGSEVITLSAPERVTYADELTLIATITPATDTQGNVAFYANGELLGSATVVYQEGESSGTATLTVKATSRNHFRVDATVVKAVFSGNRNVSGTETDAVTVKVEPKIISAQITGNADKIYDGSDAATGLAIEVEGVEDCDKDDVTAAALCYAFDDANAGKDKTVTAQGVALGGARSGNYALKTEALTTVATINKASLELPDRSFTYNGGAVFTVTLDGVSGEAVTAILTATNADVGSYAQGQYKAELDSENYALSTAGTLTIEPLTAAIAWNAPFAFVYDGEEHSVLAEVSNAIAGDRFALAYAGNAATDVGRYTAVVTALGNGNYALPAEADRTQLWRIDEANSTVALVGEDTTYGEEVTFTATIARSTAEARGIMLLSASAGTVDFYVNGTYVNFAVVAYDGTATLTVPATAANGFHAGDNDVIAQFGGSGNLSAGSGETTVTLKPRKLTATLTGATAKTYDGTVAVTDTRALIIELKNVIPGDDVSAVAEDGYAYEDADAGEDKAVTAGGIALRGAQRENYVLDAETVSGLVGRIAARGVADLTISVIPDSYPYSGSEIVPETIEVRDGENVIPENEYTVTYSNNINVGDHTAVVTVTGNEGGNYAFSGTATFSITAVDQAPLRIVGQREVTYGDRFVLDTEGGSGTGAVTWAVTEGGTHATVDGRGNVTAIGTGDVTITATKAADGNHRADVSATYRFTVKPKALTARIVGNTQKIYDGTEAAGGLSIALEGVIEGDDVTATAASYAYNSIHVTEANTITAQSISLDGAQSGNYVLDTAPVTTEGTIKAKVVRLEWSGYTDLVYTGEAVNVTATATELIPGDTCDVIVEGGTQTEAGTYTARATKLTNSDYALPEDGVTLKYTIARAEGKDPDDPSNPDNPDDPNNPDNPDNPDDPNNPDNPDNPDDPNNPDNPDNPDDPNNPDNPDNPDNPNDPNNPDNPDDPNGSGDTTGSTDGSGNTVDSSQSSGTTPKTGDATMLWLWVLLMAVSFCGIFAILAGNARSKKKDKR